MPTVTEHERNLRAMPCVVSGNWPVTLHHAHGGSMRELGPDYPSPGMGQKNNPFLQIPLHYSYHYIGAEAIDYGIGVETWEARYGAQVLLLDVVNKRLPYDLWQAAREWAGESKILPRT